MTIDEEMEWVDYHRLLGEEHAEAMKGLGAKRSGGLEVRKKKKAAA